MRAVTLAVTLALSSVLAGCVADEPDVTTQIGEEPRILHQDASITVQALDLPDIWEPTLVEPPQWRTGEWWKIRMHDQFSGEITTFYRIVAGFDNATNSYLVGMPTHGFSNLIMVLHVPGFGQVDRETLGYELHDFKMDPLKFPLEDGDTWDTSFEGAPFTTLVTVESDTVANITFAPPPNQGGRSGYYVYDAEIHAIRTFHVNGYGTYEVLEHGYDFHEALPEWDGQVTVPYQHDLIFAHGRIATALTTGQSAIPSPIFGMDPSPLDAVEVADGYDRVSFAIIIGDVLPLLGIPVTSAGYYRETASAPDGEVYTHEIIGPGFATVAFKNDNPVGIWNFEHITAGPGIAMSEGIAYKVFDVQLPDGNFIETAGEHEHEDGRGHEPGSGNETQTR